MAGHGDPAGHDDDRVVDLDRAARPDEPPVPGAQWDELYRRWERWDEAGQRWVIVGDDSGAAVKPPSANPVPLFFARELLRADELAAADEEGEDEPRVIDVDRLAAPPQPVPGAQWNEVVGRWERWDESAEAWVEARSNDSSSSATP